jgi:NitT/TauT family transport system permease protein
MAQRRGMTAPRMLGAATVVAVAALLEILIRRGVISEFVLPPPSAILASFHRVIMEEELLQRFLVTCGEALGAGVMIALVGIPVGVLMHRHKLLRAACETWVAAFAAAPLVLAYPLFLVIFGRSALTIMMMAFLAGLAPVILKTIEGLSAVRPVLLDVGRSFRLTRAQQFRLIALPAALPTIFTGLRLGLIFALINVVGVEFLINFGGLGQLINDLAERYDLPGTYAAVVFVILVSVAFFMVLERIEAWLRPGAGRAA